MVSALSNQSFVSDAERQGLAFICSSMLNSRGLVYQLIVNGEPVNSNLLESMGQMLEYAYLTGNDDLFEEILKLIMENFRTEEGYFSWKITGGRQQKASALIDDLRILKMILRQEEVKENKWQIYKETLLDSLNSSLRDEKWVSYYDGKSRKKSTRIPLFYIDLEVMKKAAEEDQRFKKAYEWAEKILMSASINQFGFFPHSYSYKTGAYIHSSKVNMVENILTALNYSAEGGDISPFLNFLKREMRKGHIFNNYSYYSGKPIDEAESAAVYALACQLFEAVGEKEYADLSYTKMLDFQIDEGTPKGGFGDAQSQTLYMPLISWNV